MPPGFSAQPTRRRQPYPPASNVATNRSTAPSRCGTTKHSLNHFHPQYNTFIHFNGKIIEIHGFSRRPCHMQLAAVQATPRLIRVTSTSSTRPRSRSSRTPGSSSAILVEQIKRHDGEAGSDGQQVKSRIRRIKEAWLARYKAKLESDAIPLNPYRVIRVHRCR
jgi:hypothetical protein